MNRTKPLLSSTTRAALERAFQQRYGETAALIQSATAPGRVNLIGEHTDYNEGWALPMAIDRSVTVTFAPRQDRLIRVASDRFDEDTCLDLDAFNDSQPRDAQWWHYIAAVAQQLELKGHKLRGIDALLGGDLPMASGLSSSAALELATARALCAASGVPWLAQDMAALCTRAENDCIGVECGVMDQIASALGEPGHALLLDCRSLTTEPVAMPSQASVVVLDTGVRRALAQSAFNQRRKSCEGAVAVLREHDPSIRALRDAAPEQLDAVRRQLSEETFRCARHVIEECQRPSSMADAFAANDLDRAGALMNDSHTSLRDLYQVSCPELDHITDSARRHSACFGARLTGAGFGGCAVALVATVQVDDFIAQVEESYRVNHTAPFNAFVTRASAGARLLE